jgi:hypothetical protein
MKSPSRPSPSLALLVALAAAASCPALTPTEWQHRQAVKVAAPGLVRVELSPASFDSGGPQQEEFRVIDPSGLETALLVDRPPVPVARVARPSSFDVKVSLGATEITIATGTADKLSALSLETPNPFFLRSARVETSPDGLDWTMLDRGVPIFREWGAEKLEIPMGGRAAPLVRITVADNKDAPIPFTGARLLLEAQPSPSALPAGSHVSGRDEFAGETVLTLALDGRNMPLAALDFETREPLFMRRVTVAIREVRGTVPSERTIGSGTIFRVALNGEPVREQLELPLVCTPDTRELLIHIHNGDSPPLAVDAVRLKRWPVTLLFMAPVAGTYSLLSGNPQAAAPHYDLAGFAGEMRGANASAVIPGDVEETPDYHPNDALGAPPMPDVPLSGAPLDAREWRFRRSIQISDPGVQELELDPEALSNARPDFADLRLLREGNQIPYVLERPVLARSLGVSPDSTPDPKRPSLSIWALHLPKAGLPLQSVILTSTTSLFQRQFRIFEKRSAQDGGTYDFTLASGGWSRTPQPGVPEDHVFEMQERARTNTLWIETDNGDNPAIAIGVVQLVYPVVRLVFKVADADSLALAYGNTSINAPRYDLGLVAGRLLTSNRNIARLGADVQETGTRNPFAGINGGMVFWGALALVVVALLAVVAKLLPKPSG